MSANEIDSHLTDIVNKVIDLNSYSEITRISNVRLIFKKDEKTKVKNYRLVSLLKIFSKIYKRFVYAN